MEYKVVVSKPFEKAFKKFASKNEALKKNILNTIKNLTNNPYDPKLRTHKLSGKLVAYLSCYCGYDCRIIFKIEQSKAEANISHLILLNIGTHDEVY